ncbi:NHLP family bacteriocin export ABC transporter peptidase/permease/ATPase subunit [Reyranella sp.]|uniref:NHLP family bacteriocin export ABC transporter peptidase/permease/ATPase subunit n=1 Tax=Reyranella sp. TaxID=1929291 RepID=UPI004035DF54
MTVRLSFRTRRVRTPTVFQMEMVESGAAALGIVLGYHGRRVPLEALRVACGVSREGSRPAELVRAADGYGLEATVATTDASRVLARPLPLIVQMNVDEYVVVEGVVGDRIYLNDPATGPREIGSKEFGDRFNGTSLEFKKRAGFKRSGGGPGLASKLGSRLKGLDGAIGFVAWVSLMLVLPGLILPGMTAVFVDNILIRQFEGWLGPMLVGLAATVVVNVALRWLLGAALLRLELRLALEQSAKFAWHVLSLPISFFAQRFTGDLASRVEANDRVATLLARDLGSTLAGCLTAAFLGGVMIFYDGVLSAIVLGGAAINIVGLQLLRRSLSDIALRLQTEQGRLFSTSAVGLQSIETLKATAGEDDFFVKWGGFHARAINSEQKLAIYQGAISLLPAMLLSLTSAAVLGVGALRVIDGHLSIGALVAFQGLLLTFSAPVQELVGVAGKVQQASADLSRLDDVLQHPRDWRFLQSPSAPAEARAIGRLSLKGVSFGYSSVGPPLIENFELETEAGQWVALVGDSGSGKSTLGKLITGLFEAQSGEILIDGYSLRDWGRERLSNVVASVDQDIRLFSGMVRDNITLWDDSVEHARLVAAVEDAGLMPAIQNLPGNLRGSIEEGGRNLNGGQRQRVEIARALVREPAILVLDEATAALDSASEHEILTAVRRRGMTCILVAHRLSTIRDCDEIIVLERGKVVERGNHGALMARDGAYARLIQAELGA